MTKEALKLALDALDEPHEVQFWNKQEKAIKAIKEALANEALDKMAENARKLGLDYEPEQPKVRTGNCLRVGVCASEGHKIQPQRTWVGLTDEEINLIYAEPQTHIGQYAKAIETKLKEKNT
jgi:hypothetical protein